MSFLKNEETVTFKDDMLKQLSLDFPHIYNSIDDVVDYRYGLYVLKAEDDLYLYDPCEHGARRLLIRESDVWDHHRCMYEFGINLNHLMRWNDIYAYELSNVTGISERTISLYLNRERLPKFKNLLFLSKALDCRIEDFTDLRWLSSKYENDYICDKDPTNFKYKLMSVMDRCNLSRKELSDRTGISQMSISRYLSGDSYPDLYDLSLMCKAMDITFKPLFEVC